MAGVEISN